MRKSGRTAGYSDGQVGCACAEAQWEIMKSARCVGSAKGLGGKIESQEAAHVQNEPQGG